MNKNNNNNNNNNNDDKLIVDRIPSYKKTSYFQNTAS